MVCSTPGSSVLHYLPGFARLTSIELMIPSNHLILCCPLLLLPSIFPSIKVFSNESALCIRWPKYWSFSISLSSEYSGLITFRIILGQIFKPWEFLCPISHRSHCTEFRRSQLSGCYDSCELFFFAADLWDPSSPTRDQTQGLHSESTESWPVDLRGVPNSGKCNADPSLPLSPHPLISTVSFTFAFISRLL